MSEWTPQVVRLENIERHPNAETLEMSTVLGGYTVIFKEGRFKQGDLASYIPSDTICSDNAEFDWLGDKKRIKPVRLRGVFSLGILAAPPPDAAENDSVVEYYGLQKFEYDEEKPEAFTDNEAPPNVVVPKYDLDALRRYKWLLEEGEEVVITEKLDGCNAAFYHDGDRLWVKSRQFFKKENPNNQWWAAAIRYNLADKLKSNPGKVFFAELYGQVKGFAYDTEVVKNQRQNKIRFFDILDPKTQTFADWSELDKIVSGMELETAPVLYTGPWSDAQWAHADGKSSIGDHIREGFVVRPAKERVHPHQGRVILKHKGEEYLLKKK
jgi:RNA ligase (TIGR02306 family)